MRYFMVLNETITVLLYLVCSYVFLGCGSYQNIISLPATLCVFGVHVSWRSSESHFINYFCLREERGNVTLNFRNKRKRKRKGEMGFLHCVPSHGSNGDDTGGKVLCCSVKLSSSHYSNNGLPGTLPVDFCTKILLLQRKT